MTTTKTAFTILQAAFGGLAATPNDAAMPDGQRLKKLSNRLQRRGKGCYGNRYGDSGGRGAFGTHANDSTTNQETHPLVANPNMTLTLALATAMKTVPTIRERRNVCLLPLDDEDEDSERSGSSSSTHTEKTQQGDSNWLAEGSSPLLGNGLLAHNINSKSLLTQDGSDIHANDRNGSYYDHHQASCPSPPRFTKKVISDHHHDTEAHDSAAGKYDCAQQNEETHPAPKTSAITLMDRIRSNRFCNLCRTSSRIRFGTSPASVIFAIDWPYSSNSGEAIAGNNSTTVGRSSSTMRSSSSFAMSRWMWYLGLAAPSALLAWGIQDENSPPAEVSEYIGLSALIKRFSYELSKPSYDKLLPDWSQIPNVPHDIPVPHTLVLDLGSTLVSSTWDRKYGWRHARRPGVDKFLHDMAQYYEIVLYSPSHEGVAQPVVDSLDKDASCIDCTAMRHIVGGVHVKDLKRLNRNLNRMIVLDDETAEVQFNPENLIRVRPYTDPTDRTDHTLTRITPFLIKIAREGYNDIPALLRQYNGMDADEIADEQDRRVRELRDFQRRQAQQGLDGWANQSLPPPELPPEDDSMLLSSSISSIRTPQLTAKDIASAAVAASNAALPATHDGLMGWMQRRAKDKEEHQMRKREKWSDVILKTQKERREAGERQQQQQQA